MSGNLVFRIQQTRFRYWIDQSPGEAIMALQALWSRDKASPAERSGSFALYFPSLSSVAREAGPPWLPY